MAMASTDAGVTGPTRARIEERTLRPDRWWLAPLTTFIVFSAFVVYATWRAFSGSNYYSAPYLSPFYSPCLGDCVDGASDFGQPFDWFPLSAALIILIFPLGFRMTCYYYRKAYYRAFWLSPPACAVAEPHGSYSGETRLPLILQNLHRYFWYAALVVAVILSYDVILAFRDEDEQWGHMGLGTVFMLVNVALIWLYTLSCHSCRHAVGGRLRHFSKHPVRYQLWTWVSRLNAHHAKFAWYSLFSVALVDLYIYLLATGAITDPRFF
ncbi:putative succinate dehydrogenase/fumarate reductase, membrane anchor subunit [metagenome]|uniref:Putative succinate dehydrogenase/fumarate reductase, membrane anchor subunit n=1 Tax=metagenome TaxID=256318 RepID=A0A2P2CE66_9ZZZZ